MVTLSLKKVAESRSKDTEAESSTELGKRTAVLVVEGDCRSCEGVEVDSDRKEVVVERKIEVVDKHRDKLEVEENCSFAEGKIERS